jgi:DNA-binding transcriptional MocR family regulator
MRFYLKHQPNPKIFDQIAEKITEQIRQGVLAPGAKVPSLRRLSKQLGVNSATINRAYWKLENDGLIECRPQSGFYVCLSRPNSKEEPGQNENEPHLTTVKQFNAKTKFFGYVFEGFSDPANLLLSFGSAGLAVLSEKSLQKSLSSALAKAGSKAFNYNWFNDGEPLKRQLARHYLDCGLTVSPKNIIPTSGCSESINVCYRAVTKPGDIVAVESPLLPMLMMVLQNYHAKIVEIPMNPHSGMDLDYLKRALKKYPIKACVSMPNFNNPLGALMPDENKKRLVEMLAEKNATLIEVDIVGDLYLGETRPKPAKAFDKKGNVLLCSSFSKVLSPGIRVGWIMADKDFRTISVSRFIGSASTNLFNEAGIADFMERGEYTRHLRKVRKFLQTNLELISQAVIRHFPEGTQVLRPRGGSVLWVEFPLKVDGFQLHREALAKKIHLFPGQAYCLSPKYKNYMSVSFSHPWSETIDKALKTVGDLAKKQLLQ